MLSHEIFGTLVRNAPLVSMDLLVRDASGRLLVGLRNNRPAKGSWFVPGGRILKDERLDDAFARISKMELGVALARGSAQFMGVHEHLYPDNMLNEPGYGTHYVVLVYALALDAEKLRLPREQHGAYRWITDAEALADANVHDNTKAYCRG